MKRLLRHVLPVVLGMALTAQAAPLRLDDSLTHTVPPNVQMQWRPMPTARDGSGDVEAWVRVNVRIDRGPSSTAAAVCTWCWKGTNPR